jgi:hypothetical protein
MNFVGPTGNITGDHGTTSIGRSSPKANRASVQTRDPEPVNILTALAENESVARKESDAERRTIALAWLFPSWGRHTSTFTHGAAIHC